jgi:hypothetical protein
VADGENNGITIMIVRKYHPSQGDHKNRAFSPNPLFCMLWRGLNTYDQNWGCFIRCAKNISPNDFLAENESSPSLPRRSLDGGMCWDFLYRATTKFFNDSLLNHTPFLGLKLEKAWKFGNNKLGRQTP